jgi:hypothetical protein
LLGVGAFHELDLADVDRLSAPDGEVVRLGQIKVSLRLPHHPSLTVHRNRHAASPEVVRHEADACRDINAGDELSEVGCDHP